MGVTDLEAAARRQKRLARTEQGLCEDCGNGPLENKHHCSICARAYRTRARERKRVLRDSGICVGCERAAAISSSMCGPCLKVQKAAKKKSVAKRVANGICACCVRPRAFARFCSIHQRARNEMRRRSRERARGAR